MEDKQQAGPSSEKTSPPKEPDPNLDACSERFDPMQALYAPAPPSSRLNVKIYNNLAQFDVALAKLGILEVGNPQAVIPKPQTKAAKAEASRAQADKPDEKKYMDIPGRRFLLHQAPVATTGMKKRHFRSLFSRINDITGPLAALRNYMEKGQRVKVYTRKEKGVRGVTTGLLKVFDKNWNILLEDVCEIWKRRKYKFSENLVCAGHAQDCSAKLKKLGIKLPQQEVVALNRKYVECRRRCKQLMIRGEQVVLITPYTEQNN